MCMKGHLTVQRFVSNGFGFTPAMVPKRLKRSFMLTVVASPVTDGAHRRSTERP